MPVSREVVDTTPRTAVRTRVSRRAPPYVLAGAGLAAIAVGAFSLVELRGFSVAGGAVPLLLVGAGSIAASLVVHRAYGPRRNPAPKGSGGVTRAVSVPSLNGTKPSPPGTRHDSPRRPSAVRGARSSGTPRTKPGDAPWSTWAPAGSHLPADLVGPVRESADRRPPVDIELPFTDGAAELVRPDAGQVTPGGPVSLPPVPAMRGEAVPSGTALARPSLSTRELLVPESLARSLDEDTEESEEIPTRLLPATDSPQYLIQLEALTPTPPHLRGPKFRKPDPLSPPDTAVGSLVSCSTCATGPLTLHDWGPCLGCGRPVCSSCLRTAVTSYGGGCCSPCARSLGLDLSTPPSR